MHNNQSSYNRWSWIVALILVLLLLWMLLSGRGPSHACCGAPAEAAAPVEEAMPVTPVAEAFGFTSTANDFTSSGVSSKVSWFSKSDALKALLSGGDALQAKGDDKNVVLTGTVDADATKQQKAQTHKHFLGLRWP